MKMLLSWRAPALSLMVFLLMIGIWPLIIMMLTQTVIAQLCFRALVRPGS